MRSLLALFIAIAAFNVSAADTYVDTHGNDANDCLTLATKCLTIQRCVDAAGPYGLCSIAPGTYYAGANIFYYKGVTVSGDCSNPSAVQIQLPGGSLGYFVQDHATVILKCQYITTTGNYTTGMRSRNFAIMDYDRVYFGAMPLGTHVDVQEQSRSICLGGVIIYGGAHTHVNVAGVSSYSGNCDVALVNSPAFTYYLTVGHRSLAELYGATFAGAGTTGIRYTVTNGTLVLNGVTLPGNAAGILTANTAGYVQ